MAYISFQPKDFFNTNIWTGTGVGSRAITGVGFQPDSTWIKSRSDGTDFMVINTVMGVTKYINTNVAIVEATDAQNLLSFDSDGYTLGTANYTNWNTKTFCGINWKAGTTAVPSGGTITPSACSFNTTTGFGMYKYTGTGSAATIAHGLTHAPEILLTKSLDTAAHTWGGYSKAVGNRYIMVLNNTAAKAGPYTQYWNDTDPTDTVFSIGTDSYQNQSGTAYICFCFSSVKGYSKMGGYTGNGNVDGPFVYTGFRPAFVMTKKYSSTGNWIMGYQSTNPGNVVGNQVEANSAAVEYTSDRFDMLSNGFKYRSSGSDGNGSGAEYIYMAFAEFPIVSSNSKAGVAR
jgi:hypothetical protein